MEWLAVLLELLPLAVLAGVIGLDVVSFPQVMVSRPIVAATIGGAFVGAPVAGLLCGAALECLALEALPVGASRYPEWGSSSVVAGAIAGLVAITPAAGFVNPTGGLIIGIGGAILIVMGILIWTGEFFRLNIEAQSLLDRLGLDFWNSI